ncbi:MAG: hypothetical protein V8R44_03650 [Eggerthellaceae bacterium]
MQFNNEGKATHSLKAGETLYVYGLGDGWNYKVSEAVRDGFAQEGTDLEGAIAAGQTVNAKVVNTYSASGKLEGQKGLAGEKILTGRAWLSTDKFTFVLKPAEGSVGVPMPEGSVDNVATKEVTASRRARPLVRLSPSTSVTSRTPSRVCIPTRLVNPQSRARLTQA